MDPVKSPLRNMLNNRCSTIWIAVVILLLLIGASIGLLSHRENKLGDALPGEPEYSEMLSMSTIWAEALKTRDGEPRFEIMSEKLQGEFIEGQKLRSDPWNFNIGVSSPWVTDYEITVHQNSAEILYHMTDSTQGIYDMREIIYFGEENGKTVVTEAEELPGDWERYDDYAPTDVIGATEIDIFEFEKLLYLSPLSSSTFDYAESRMKGSICIVTNERFKIDNFNEDDYELQNPKYTEEKMTDDMTQAFEKSTMSKISISEYKEKYRYTMYIWKLK
ncbi:MAG TPA: hypothetical protein VEA58_01615 [Anaerovoracaceae bacterium]|nr:hypothetical protein [Anaerovoracaceae bacterium]